MHMNTFLLHALEYLGSDEIPNHEGQREHQHLHSITCHFRILLAINVKVVEVNRILIGQGDHGGIRHHSLQAFRQPFPHRPESCGRQQWLSFAVDEVWTPQDLGVTMENSRDNMVSK